MVPPDREVSPEIQENARRFQEYRDTPRTEVQVGSYNDDSSVNVRLPDGTMTTTRMGPNDLGNLLNQVEDGTISPGNL